MTNLNKGQEIFIQSFKHDGSLHRTWSKGLVLDETDDYYVVVTDHTWVVESDGRRWLTKEPAICFFYKDKWYNVISMIRKAGIYFYCNIATPSLLDEEAIKNIDYDLDVKVFPDGTYMVLDENEYEYHAQLMNYSEKTKRIIEDSLKEVIEMVEKKAEPFNQNFINNYLMEYFKLVFETKIEQ